MLLPVQQKADEGQATCRNKKSNYFATENVVACLIKKYAQ